MKIKSLLLLSFALLAFGAAQAQVHETPQPVPPAVAAKPHVKAEAAAKKKHKPAKKTAARKGKKKPAKHGKSSTKSHKHSVH